MDVTTYDNDIAHRVAPRYAAERRPKPIVRKFSRRLAREQVVALRRKVTANIIPSSVGFREQDSMESAGIFNHLSPRLQNLLLDARKFKERFNYAYCWAKNSTIWLRENEGSRPFGKQIFLMDDTNSNLLRFHTCKYAQNFNLYLQSLNSTPSIDKPTRVYNDSYSLIHKIT